MKQNKDQNYKTGVLEFEDNLLLPALYGEHNSFLSRIENEFGCELIGKGNLLSVEGPEEACNLSRDVLLSLYNRLEEGLDVTLDDVDGAIRLVAMFEPPTANNADRRENIANDDNVIRTRKALISPRSVNQAKYIEALRYGNMTFGLGPAGTGKTFLAVAMAVSHLLEGKVERIILSRPAVEAGEKLGFLPGDLKEKVDPYLRPLYDALGQMISMEQTEKRLERGEIEVAPLAFMRGRTLSDAFVILDEAQNTTPMQMKMFLTRFGQNCHMVVCGDPSQTDLPDGSVSGLKDALDTIKGINDIAFIEFNADDVVRHKLVGKIVRAYDEKESRKS
ncbi:MAG: PhoH family protein [Kordiimonadaceae bacterium]|jgi:phosphate starvation-inducible protein PhoH and related proteins|nr:PhoH family protein [Kordiimonadaceae bacterium]MBT6036648.1 PhoH family protein [Kordiimonadaceae bacterium]MBT6329544.1 PhoH family protein [Kordiimonadaceae bacterium]MBT7583826.1 PhoH family protein [Kordiimonadaceae bacterium]